MGPLADPAATGPPTGEGASQRSPHGALPPDADADALLPHLERTHTVYRSQRFSRYAFVTCAVVLSVMAMVLAAVRREPAALVLVVILVPPPAWLLHVLGRRRERRAESALRQAQGRGSSSTGRGNP